MQLIITMNVKLVGEMIFTWPNLASHTKKLLRFTSEKINKKAFKMWNFLRTVDVKMIVEIVLLLTNIFLQKCLKTCFVLLLKNILKNAFKRPNFLRTTDMLMVGESDLVSTNIFLKSVWTYTSTSTLINILNL